MSERRPPYTTRGLPRTDEPTHQAHQRIAELDADVVAQRGQNEALLRQSLERAEETAELRQHLAALEAAAREVCVWQDGGLAISRDQAIRELAKLIAYPGWYQL